jgi:hypothetical protein
MRFCVEGLKLLKIVHAERVAPELGVLYRGVSSVHVA